MPATAATRRYPTPSLGCGRASVETSISRCVRSLRRGLKRPPGHHGVGKSHGHPSGRGRGLNPTLPAWYHHCSVTRLRTVVALRALSGALARARAWVETTRCGCAPRAWSLAHARALVETWMQRPHVTTVPSLARPGRGLKLLDDAPIRTDCHSPARGRGLKRHGDRRSP